MIVKKIVNPRKSSPKHVRVTRLAEYIRAPERDDSTEKCVYAGARGFIASTAAGQTCEMVALAEDAYRSDDPLLHLVLSWRDGERPTNAQVEEAVTILLKELGIPDHQAIYGLHADTANYHLHVLVNRADPVPRIHPKTGDLETRVVKINNGFDIEAAHRAGVLIEHSQGWQVEAKKRWRVGEGGKLVPTDPDPKTPSRPRRRQQRRPNQRQRDMEHRTGEKSVLRIAIETLSPLVDALGDWEDLHETLREKGYGYDRTGSGAVITAGDVTLKASSVDRRLSLRSLEARFKAPYQARDPALTPSRHPRDVVPLLDAAQSWGECHKALATIDGRYEQVGRGGSIVVGNHAMPAHAVSPRVSVKALEERFGPYQPAARVPTRGHVHPQPETIASPTVDPEAIATRIDRAKTWDGLHKSLDETGARYDKVGSGTRISGRGFDLKASEVSRRATLRNLQVRLGPYEPRADAPEPPKPRPLDPEYPEREAYVRARDAYRTARDAAWLADETQYERSHEKLRRQQAEERRTVLDAHDWTGRGRDLNAMRSVLAAQQAQEQTDLRATRRRAREKRRRRFPPWPSYRDWVHDQARPESERRWSGTRPPRAFIDGDRAPRPVQPRDIGKYQPRAVGRIVVYRHRDTPQRTAFVDLGQRVTIQNHTNPDAVLAAFRLSQQKWGRFRIRGDAAFKRLAVRLAAQHGFSVCNPELQDAIAAERRRLAREAAKRRRQEIARELRAAASALRARRRSLRASLRPRVRSLRNAMASTRDRGRTIRKTLSSGRQRLSTGGEALFNRARALLQAEIERWRCHVDVGGAGTRYKIYDTRNPDDSFVTANRQQAVFLMAHLQAPRGLVRRPSSDDIDEVERNVRKAEQVALQHANAPGD